MGVVWRAPGGYKSLPLLSSAQAHTNGRKLLSNCIAGTPGCTTGGRRLLSSGTPNTTAGARRLLQNDQVLGAFALNGPMNTAVSQDGSVSISLSQAGGAGFTSNQAYPFGSFSIDAKLPAGYSAGVCTTFFLINGDYNTRGEWDFEYLGSASDGNGMTLQTNYFQGGAGQHEVVAPYGFDPSADFHTYTIEWLPAQTTWYVDGNAIRTVANDGSGAYPTAPMTVAVSIWDASQWATGPYTARIPVNYAYAPFTSTFRNFRYAAAGTDSDGDNDGDE